MIEINKLKLTAKEQNILSILNAIINNGEASSVDIGKDTGLSVSTISRVLNLLKSKNVIVNVGKEQTDLGRRPDIFRLNRNYGYMVFIDIYYEKLISYLSDLDGRILDTEEYYFEQENNLEIFKNGLDIVYGRLLETKKLEGSNVLAVGISVPGVVNEEDNTITRIPNIYSFSELNLSDYIENIINAPVVLCNESTLSAIGLANEEYPNCRTLVYISFTEPTGIGAGIVIDGKPYKGATNAAGEIGSMFVDISCFDKEYSSIGCMESNAGVGKLFNELNEAMESGKSKKLKQLMDETNNKKLTIDLIEKSIQMMDYDTQEIYDRYIKIWSIGIINSMVMIDPDIIVIGGKIKSNNELTLEKIKHYVRKGTYTEPDIRISKMGIKAMLAGGLNITRNHIFNNIIAENAIK